MCYDEERQSKRAHDEEDCAPLLTEKPLASILRRKHDPSARRQGLHGRTGRRIDRRRFHEHFQSLERDVPGPHIPSWRRRDSPYYVTALELEYGMDAHLDAEHNWETLPELLAEHALVAPAESRGSKRCTRRQSDGAHVTEYRLEPVGMLLPEPKARCSQERAFEHADHRLFRLHGRRPRLWATPSMGAPEGFESLRLLKASRLGTVGQPRSASKATRGAPRSSPVVRSGGPAWDVETAGGVGAAVLEIDLGCSCRVDGFSTQGAPPFTRTYPHTWQDWETRRFFVENKPGWDPNERYRGPFWEVVCLNSAELGPFDRRRERGQACEDLLRLRWVKQFELLYRTEGGRQWHSLGPFSANHDATTEVAHDLRSLKPKLVARYLRVVPLACEGGGALRVGVYGAHMSARGGGGGGGGDRNPHPERQEDEPPSYVSYRLTKPAEGAARQQFHHYGPITYEGNGQCRRRDWDSRNLHARRRVAKRSALASGQD